MRRAGFVAVLGAAAACNEIIARPLSSAPANACDEHPCGAYDADAGALAPICRSNRCELPTAGNLPNYPFWVVLSLPDTSFFAPGLSYVFAANANGEPAFKRPVQPNPQCTPPTCLQTDGDAFLSGRYVARLDATNLVKATLDTATAAPIAAVTGDQPIPVRAMFFPTGNAQQATFPVLPVGAIVATSGTDPGLGSALDYGRTLLAGAYTRELYPQPPFDAIYPPVTSSIAFDSARRTDRSELTLAAEGDGVTPLDFTTNRCTVEETAQRDTRCAIVGREEGLDGWRVWLEDAETGKRISVIRTFSNTIVDDRVSVVTEAAALLYTAVGTNLGDRLNAVVAPPPSTIGVPRYQSLLVGLQGLQNLRIPTFPPPVEVLGVVAEPGAADAGASLLGYAARVSLVSTSLTTAAGPNPLLRYSTTVSTDDRGRFSTILPPGNYTATVEPAVGTRFAKATIDVVVDRIVTALRLQPPPRATLRGRAVLTDERPAAEASVLLTPVERTDDAGNVVLGRPASTTVAPDGTYAVDLDPGAYVLSVIPKPSTGFPRVLKRVVVGAEPVTAPDVRIPPPSHLSFELRDPNAPGNPISRAVVRFFTTFADDTLPVEIGSTLTDADGRVEILLAPRPD